MGGSVVKRKSRKKAEPVSPSLTRIREVLALQEEEQQLRGVLKETVSRIDHLLRGSWKQGHPPNFIVADSQVYMVVFKSRENRFCLEPASVNNVLNCDGAVPEPEVAP